MDIYWIQDKHRRGPATVPDVLSLVKMGELTPDTLGWHAGCEGWKPLRELPALADFLNEPEPPPAPDAQSAPAEHADAAPTDAPVAAAPESAPEAEVKPLFVPSAACRFMARALDVSLYLALVYAAFYIRRIPFDPSLLPGNPFFWLAFVLLEASLLHWFGTTPGKAFFGIRLRSLESTQPLAFTWLRSLQRSVLVFIGGMGMMVSFLPLLMGLWSWWQLRSRGITFWDAIVRAIPVQSRPTGRMRLLLGLVLVLLCTQLISYCMEPWLPAMLDSIEAQSPATADMLRQMMAK